MKARSTRTDLTARNRESLLAAARKVFLARGFQGASLEAIAVEAGFSKGLVYSQFDSKADLFLALLERRREERAAVNAMLARPGSGLTGLADLLRHWESTASGEPAWTLLVMEFRIHAARDRTIGRRYAELHRRTIDGIASVLDALFPTTATTLPMPAAALASLILAIGAGVALERANDQDALPAPATISMLERLFAETPSAPSARARRKGAAA